MRRKLEFDTIESISINRLLNFCRRFEPLVVLNSNTKEQIHTDPYHQFDILIGAGLIERLTETNDLFGQIKKTHLANPDWWFGYVSYDVKNQLEHLESNNNDGIQALEIFLFRPQYVFAFNGAKLSVEYDSVIDDENSIQRIVDELMKSQDEFQEKNSVAIVPVVSREKYIQNVNSIKKHIQHGDIYEINYCVEYFAKDVEINPVSLYCRLNQLSPMPFSAFARTNHIQLICASPERFLAKRKNKVISQPIKGTVRRGKNEEEDTILIDKLKNDPKERSENVMIVDLVRNDLSRTAKKGSVKVEELFGIKSFRQLHHMISTVTSELKHDLHFTDVMKSAFPMGSMTGAPKIKAMELIEKFEETKRGLYSGTIGYITPSGDFDFNVIIRSILYNSENRYLSYMVGSAITDSALSEKEYEECLLKAKAMSQVLGEEI
jgi:para-aminobenzoate synthetase component 1